MVQTQIEMPVLRTALATLWWGRWLHRGTREASGCWECARGLGGGYTGVSVCTIIHKAHYYLCISLYACDTSIKRYFVLFCFVRPLFIFRKNWK